MQSDWEIDPDELEIARKPDGTEWRLGSGASAHVWISNPGRDNMTSHALELPALLLRSGLVFKA